MGGWRGRRLHREPRRYGGGGWGWTSTGRGRGETHKAAYVSSVMRTGDFSFRACECKRKMNVFHPSLTSFLPFAHCPQYATDVHPFTREWVVAWVVQAATDPTTGSMSFFLFFLRIRNGILGIESSALKCITRS